MNSKQAKRLKWRCLALWNGPLAGVLQESYGVGGFDRFYRHAKKDYKSGHEDVLDALERDAEATREKMREEGFDV